MRTENKIAAVRIMWLYRLTWPLVTIMIHGCTRGVANNITRTAIIHELLQDYDFKLPPNFNGNEPLIVSCGMFINSFDSVSETSMDYSLSIFLRQQWTDPRLRYQHLSNDMVLSLDWRMLERLWVPDLFVSNEKEAHFHNVMTPNTYLRIYPPGEVHYSARVSFRLSCPMFLHKFPLDTQVCGITIETYAYEMSQLVFHWYKDSPVEFNPDLQMPQFQLVKHTVEENVKGYSTGNFSALKVNFFLKRDIGYYIIQIYIPSILIVILSWVSFWISLEAVPARISLGVLTVLTMTTQTSGLTSRLPKVSYIKAIDVWLSTCLVFVFTALLEFAIVNVLCRNERLWTRLSRRDRRDGSHTTSDDKQKSNDNRQRASMLSKESNGIKKTFQHKKSALLVDNLSRILFPVAFLLFNVVYWLTYYNVTDIMPDEGFPD